MAALDLIIITDRKEAEEKNTNRQFVKFKLFQIYFPNFPLFVFVCFVCAKGERVVEK